MKLTLSLILFIASIVAVFWLTFATDLPRWTIAAAMMAMFVAAVAMVVNFVDKWGDKTPDMPGYD